MNAKKKIIKALLVIIFLINSMIPVSAEIGFGFDADNKVQVFSGTFRDVYLMGDNVTVFAVLWKMGEGGLSDKQVTFRIYREGELVETINATTDENGFVKVTFVPEENGYYSVQVCYRDICTESWQGDFVVLEKIEQYYFVPKDFVARVNSTVILRWTLINPFTRLPCSKSVNLTIPELGIREQLTPVNGTVEYALNLSEVAPDIDGYYEIYLDNREAGRVWITKNPGLFVIGNREIYEGENATVLAFLYDPVEGEPVSGNLTLDITYNYRNGSVIAETRTIEILNGYHILSITNTTNVKGIDLRFYTPNQDRYFYVEVIPRPSYEAPEVTFEIEPSRQIAYPGQSVTLVIKGYNITDNTPPKGNYTLIIRWYGWNGRSWDWYYLGQNETEIHFGDQNEVMRRIKIPEDAYYGRVYIGNAYAEIDVIRPDLDTWSTLVDFEYNETTHEFKVDNETYVNGRLYNRTYRWYYEWDDYYKSLSNETIYLFYWNGTKITKTDEAGRFSVKIPVSVDEKLPIGFGEEMQKLWYLSIHRSGAWDTGDIELSKIHVFYELVNSQLRLYKYYDWGHHETSIPVVVELSKTALDDDFITNNLLSTYWNTSNATYELNISPGVYVITVLPTPWICHDSGCSSSSGIYHYEKIVVFPNGTQFFQKEYTTDKPGYLEIPIKLPEKGIFFVRYWKDGEHFYFNETDENGNGIVKIYVPAGSSGMSYWYYVYFGFMTEHYVILGAETWFNIELTEDTLPPLISLDVIPQVQDVGNNVTIRYEVKDSGGIDTIKVEITNITDTINSTTIKVNGATSYTEEFNFTIRGLEDYMVKIWANDTRGNMAYKIVNFFGRLKKEETVNLEENETQEVQIGEKAEITVNSAETKNVKMNITVTSEIEDNDAKFKIEGKGFEDLTYIKVETNETIRYNWVILNLTYDENVLKKLGIPESAVKLFYWNGSEWIDLEENVGGAISDNSPYGNITIYGFRRDTEHNYVWANVSHLSDYVLAVALPDLTVVSILPTTAYTGEETNIVVKIENLGGTTDKPFKVALYIDDQLYDVKEVSDMGSEETKDVVFIWTPQVNKTYTIKAVVDYGNDIYESNETNNEKSAAITVVNKQVSTVSPQEGISIKTINFLYYMYYNRMIKKFDELYNKSLEVGVANETLQEALKYKELAERYYNNAQQYEPILSNIGNPRLLASLRKAYLNIKKAIEILENELNNV